MTETILEFKYKIRISMITFWEYDEPEITLQVTPDFDGYNRDIEDDCVVLDPYFLIDSIEWSEDCSHYPLTCECGCADDVGIYAPMDIHYDQQYVYWTYDVQAYKGILIPPNNQTEGRFTLTFEKQQYRQAVLELLKQLKQLIQNKIEIKSLTSDDFTRSYGSYEMLKFVFKDHPTLTHLTIDKINPYDSRLVDDILDFQFVD